MNTNKAIFLIFRDMFQADKVRKLIFCLMQRMDLDGDGQLDYREFTSLIFRQKDRKMADADMIQKRKLSKPRIKPTKMKKNSKSKE